MRILLLATDFPKPANPLMGTWALDQAQALRRGGATVEVISLTSWIPRWPGQSRGMRAYATCPSSAEWDGLTVHYPRWPHYPVTALERLYLAHPEPWLRAAWAACGATVTRLARTFAPDVIFAHHSLVNGWVARQLARELGKPFFCQDHALWEIDSCQRHPARQRLFQGIAAEATRMFAVSKRMANDIRKVAPAAPVGVLHNGANFPAPSAHPASTSERGPVIFSAGMFVAYKGFDVLLRAWAEVHRDYPEARLRIAGDGPDRDQLFALRNNLALGDSVEFLGYQPQTIVQAEMASACAFALASWHETFGVVFLEAAAVGTPCIWVNNAGVADVLVDGVHGRSVAPHDPRAIADAIVQMLTHPQDAATMGAAAARLVKEHCTWDAVARRALELFATLAIRPEAHVLKP